MLGGIVRGKKVALRTPTEEDLPFFDTLMADVRVRRGGQVWAEPALQATWKERYKEAAKEPDSVLWTIDADAVRVGFIRVAWHHDIGHCDVRDLVIDPTQWRKGFGTDAATALHRYVFDYMDKRTSAVELPADNVAALRIAEKLGFVEFGRGHEVYYRDGAYVDKVFLRFDRAVWDEKWGASEREYAPLPDGIDR